MKLSEATQALKDGKRLSSKTFHKSVKYIYLRRIDGKVYNDQDEIYYFYDSISSDIKDLIEKSLIDPETELEIYEPPIQLLNAIEALEALKDGKKIITNGIDFNDRHFSYIELDENGDITSPHAGAISNGCVDLTDLYEKKFLVYELEQETKKDYTLDDAFKDLRELYNHLLVDKLHPLDDTETQHKQCVFRVANFTMDSIYVDKHNGREYNLDFLSPIFKNRDDALQVMADFGEQRLLKMFKRLKGIE